MEERKPSGREGVRLADLGYHLENLQNLGVLGPQQEARRQWGTQTLGHEGKRAGRTPRLQRKGIH